MILDRPLANLYLALGDLPAGANAAREALALARKAENKQDESQSLAWIAWAAHLRGDLTAATDTFSQAETLEKEIYASHNIQYLYGNRGIFHADHLRRLAAAASPLQAGGEGPGVRSRYITEANLEIVEQYRVIKDISMCHRVLGDLDADAGAVDNARAHYDKALYIARNISDRATLIGALLARGCFNAKRDGSGLGDLEEALAYALQGGYRRYEADIRVALAWQYLIGGDEERGRGGDLARARQEAARARALSEQMGYHWGKVDAEEVEGERGRQGDKVTR